MGLGTRSDVSTVLHLFLLCFYPCRSKGNVMQTASVKWIGEEQFVGTSPSGHLVVFDTDSKSNKAPTPMEMLLLALGSCTAVDVVGILKKKRQKLDALEVICSGERAPDPPKVWTKLEIVFRLRGTLDDAAVKRAIELSEGKYCSVAAMLKKTATLSWRYEILAPEK
jgi:putative redox protein